jgi:hypothetical protein
VNNEFLLQVVQLYVVHFTTLFQQLRQYSVECNGNKGKMNCKVFGKKRSWTNFKVHTRHSPGRTEKKHENPKPGCWSSYRDLNPRPAEYGAGVLTTRL